MRPIRYSSTRATFDPSSDSVPEPIEPNSDRPEETWDLTHVNLLAITDFSKEVPFEYVTIVWTWKLHD